MSPVAETFAAAVYSSRGCGGSDDDDDDDHYYSVSSSSSDDGDCSAASVANPVRTVNVALYRSNTLVAVCKLTGTLGARSYNMLVFLDRHTEAHGVHFAASHVALLVNPVLFNHGPDSADAHANCITVHLAGWNALATFVGPNPDDDDVVVVVPPPRRLPPPLIPPTAVAAPARATQRALRRVHTC